MLPCGCPELYVHAAETAEQPARCLLVGQMSRAVASGTNPVKSGAVVFRFLPYGAGALFGLRMDAMTDRRVPLSELFGRMGRQFEEQSAQWRTMEERMAAGTAFLLARKPHSAPDPLVRELVQRIEECRGQVALAVLKRSFTISARQLERRFTLSVGLTPKLFARIMRLSYFAEHAERYAERTLAEIAREVGYFDPAHLNHDFKAMTGMTPKEFFGARTMDARAMKVAHRGRAQMTRRARKNAMATGGAEGGPQMAQMGIGGGDGVGRR